jgi:hypothetical protein
MGVSEAAAGTLDGLSGGLSSEIAGKIIGFESECADFGTAFDVTKVVAGNTPWGRVGKGVRFAAKGSKGVKGSPTPTPNFKPPTNPPQMPPPYLPPGIDVRVIPPTAQYRTGTG